MIRTLGVEADDLIAPLEELKQEKKVIAAELPIKNDIKAGLEHLEFQTDEAGETEKCYYLAPYYYMELAVARMLIDLDIKPEVKKKKLEASIEKIQKELEIELDPIQKSAVEAAAGSGVMVLTGGPGTGKTTIIKAIIRLFEMEGMDILLAAPTGRAAKRMNEATGREASTIHRMLQMRGSDDGSEDSTGQKGGFERNESNPLETDVIIIDEMSMVDISLMNALLKATSLGTKLILVGDANQLPPVGAGNVLRDILASKVFTTVCLTKIFRQAEQSDIVINAHKINKGEEVALDNKSKDFLFVKRDNQNDICGVVIALVRDKLPKYVNASAMDIQVLTPSRKGDLGVGRMNMLLQAYLNPPDPKKKERQFGDITFREGDKVMQIRNNYQLEWEARNSRGFVLASGSGIFNGDCGIIKSINTFSEELEIVFDEDKRVFYPFSLMEDLELAYCITVHKSQGSEYPAVVLPLLSGPRQLFNRNLLYTAVTRAKKCVTIVGSRQAVYDMIKNEMEQKRYSGLAENLMKMKQ